MILKPLLTIGLGLFLSGCVLAPKEAEQTKRDLIGAGETYKTDRASRMIPDLPDHPTWQDALRRAFLSNGDLEAAYFEWAMAVSKIDQAGSYPSQPVEIGFEYMFSAEKMKSFDRTTVSAGLMDATAWPTKTYQSAKIAWREAQSAGERFVAAKFKVQRDVLVAWNDYVLQLERVRIQNENVQLLRLVSETAAGRVRTGASQQDLLRADVQLKLAENDLATMQSELTRQRARLNALLLRPPGAPLEALALKPRRLIGDDAVLLALGVDRNPELRALNIQITGREDALERARMEYLPDFNPMAGFTGGVSQFIGASLVLPTELPKIRAMIEESRADLRRAQAMRDQTRASSGADYVASIVALRNAERQIKLFEQTIVPLARQTVELSRQAYSAGTGTYLDLIDSQRTLLDVRVTLAEAHAEREKMLAEIEMLAGADLETLATPASPATQPAQPEELP